MTTTQPARPGQDDTTALSPGTAAALPGAAWPPARVLRRTTRRACRPRRALPAVLLAAVLAVLATLAAIAIISTRAGHPLGVLPAGWLDRTARDLRWDSTATLAIAAALATVGLGLLWLALAPGRPRMIPLAPADPYTITAITRSGLRRCLAAAALSVDGTVTARIRLHRRRVHVHATTALHEAPGLAGAVQDAVADQCQALATSRALRVRATISKTTY